MNKPETLFAGDCILTYSGHYLNVFDPNPDHICIQDIAHALSYIPRFAGHLVKPLSVARHSLNVAALVPMEYMLEALLHDASEAYLMDIPKPIKKHLPDYQKLEDNLMSAIAKKFGFDFPMSQKIKDADKQMLEIEHHELRVLKAKDYKPTTPEEDKEHFMFTYLFLTNNGPRKEAKNDIG